jgi:hypothetical protein
MERLTPRLRACRDNPSILGMPAFVQTPVLSGRRPVVKGHFEDTVNVSGAVMSSAF